MRNYLHGYSGLNQCLELSTMSVQIHNVVVCISYQIAAIRILYPTTLHIFNALIVGDDQFLSFFKVKRKKIRHIIEKFYSHYNN